MTEMYRVSKVLNNNGVIAIDMDENKEYVILGKGVGFGKKVSQRFDKPEGCTTYRLEQETERGSAKELVKGIEPEYLEIADAILTPFNGIFQCLSNQHCSHAAGRTASAGKAACIFVIGIKNNGQVRSVLKDEKTLRTDHAG